MGDDVAIVGGWLDEVRDLNATDAASVIQAKLRQCYANIPMFSVHVGMTYGAMRLYKISGAVGVMALLSPPSKTTRSAIKKFKGNRDIFQMVLEMLLRNTY